MNKKTTYLNVLFKKRTKIILQDYRNCLFYKVQKMLAPIFVPNLIFISIIACRLLSFDWKSIGCPGKIMRVVQLQQICV